MAYERKGGKKSGDFGSTKKTDKRSSFKDDKKPYGDKSKNTFGAKRKEDGYGKSDFSSSRGSRPDCTFKKDGFRDDKKKSFGTDFKKRDDSDFKKPSRFDKDSNDGSEKKRSYKPKDFSAPRDGSFIRKPRDYSKSKDEGFTPYPKKGLGDSYQREDDPDFKLPRKFSSEDGSDAAKPRSKQKEFSKPTGVSRGKSTGGYPKSLENKFAAKAKENPELKAPRSFSKDNDKSKSEKRPYTKRDSSGGFKSPRSFSKDRESDKDSKRPYVKRDSDNSEIKPHRKFSKDAGDDKKRSFPAKTGFGSDFKRKERSFDKKKNSKNEGTNDGTIRLNRYIAVGGMCSRREADVFISEGLVRVNNIIITEMGYKVQPGDVVKFDDRTVKPEKNVYILLNKPKDYITTSEDPNGRKTVMQLIKGACKERVFPIGRLDRNTTGLLLMTNDGQMADKLMHPRKKVKKIYHAELDKVFKGEHIDALREGLELEDGFFKPDVVEYSTATNADKTMVGIEIHSGRNRIVRRLFEHLGYNVVKLDRVFYAGLTKKNLPRGHWRMLEEHELNILKML